MPHIPVMVRGNSAGHVAHPQQLHHPAGQAGGVSVAIGAMTMVWAKGPTNTLSSVSVFINKTSMHWQLCFRDIPSRKSGPAPAERMASASRGKKRAREDLQLESHVHNVFFVECSNTVQREAAALALSFPTRLHISSKMHSNVTEIVSCFTDTQS